MPRPPRDFRPGRMYLVSQQGNKQISVYVDEQDRAYADELLSVCSRRYKVEVIAWGLGEYEGRWLLRPSTRCGISNMMRDMQSGYSRFLNSKYNHHPCCARRRHSGHRSNKRSDWIRNSSNWTPRFKVTEVSPECREMAIGLVKAVRLEQPGRAKGKEQKPLRPTRDLMVLREALQRSIPLAVVKEWRSQMRV